MFIGIAIKIGQMVAVLFGGATPGQNVDLQDGTDLSFQDGTNYTYQ